MSARLAVVAGALALALAGGATWVLLEEPEAGPSVGDEGLSRERARGGGSTDAGPRGALGRALRGERGRSAAVEGVLPELSAEAGMPGDTELDAKEAEAGLANVFAELDQVLADRRRLSAAEYDRWHERAGAAFAAFQEHVDAEMPEARARLDRAHRQLEDRLERLRGRVKTPARKRRPDPDPRPRLDANL